MNVALTRAKFACYVLGRETTLRSSQPWAAFLDHAYARKCIVHLENPSCNLTTLRPMLRPGTSSTEASQELSKAPKLPLKLFQSVAQPSIFDAGGRDLNEGVRHDLKTKKKHSRRENEPRQNHPPNSIKVEPSERRSNAGSKVNARDPRRFKRSS